MAEHVWNEPYASKFTMIINISILKGLTDTIMGKIRTGKRVKQCNANQVGYKRKVSINNAKDERRKLLDRKESKCYKQ